MGQILDYHIHTYVHTYVCMYVHMYVCTYACMYICMYVHVSLCRKKGSAKQSVAELASRLAEMTAVLPEVAAKPQQSPVAGTEVTAKKKNGALTTPMFSDQQHRKSSLLPAVPEGKPSIVSPVHSRGSVAHQCERGPNSSITPPLPPVAQQGMQGEVEERSIAPSHPPGHSRLQSEYHRRDGNK